MDKTLLDVREELTEKLKVIQRSGKETSEGWEVLDYLKVVEGTIRLIGNSIYIGVGK